MSAGQVRHQRRAGGRPRGSVGPVRAALMAAIRAGVCGSVDALASHTGWPPQRVRLAVKEMVRANDLPPPERDAQPGRGGQPPGVYGWREMPEQVNALAFVQAVWR